MSISARWHRLVEDIWYGKHPARLLLAPLGWLFRGVAWLRRAVYASGLLSAYQAPVPVVVVGNITVGGTGKTPLIIGLVVALIVSAVLVVGFTIAMASFGGGM